jgi:hypothetical protein
LHLSNRLYEGLVSLIGSRNALGFSKTLDRNLHFFLGDLMKPAGDFVRGRTRQLWMMKLMNKASDDFANHLHVLGVMLPRSLHELAPESEVKVMYKMHISATVAVYRKKKVCKLVTKQRQSR